MKKSELYKKLQNLSPKALIEIGINNADIDYIKNKLLNDTLGLKLNFTEIDEKLKSNYVLLEENKHLSITPPPPPEIASNNHILIEGENYYALKALKTANVKVDVIYIDPPYNTGKEFIYNDDFSTKKIVGSDDPHKHSKWLSFIKKRLQIAKDLLSDDGVIFVSIDDNEQAYLKVLMDEIFGENNFIANFDWISKPGGQSDNKYIASTKQYILMYKKSDLFSIAKIYIDIDKNKIYGIDNRGTYLKSTELNSPAGEDGKYVWQRPNLGFHISYKPETKDFIFDPSWDFEKNIYIPPNSRKGYFVASPKKHNLCWRWNKESFKNKINDIILETKDNGTLRIFKKQYIENLKKQTFIKDDLIRNITQSSGTLNFSALFKNTEISKQSELKKFSFPKPVKLIKEILSLHSNKNAIVLDFFAGSGTTGQAVMELNQEDGGNRKFILVTNNENDIAKKTTCERIYRVIKGHGSNNETFKWEYSNDQKSLINNSMKYLKVKLVHKQNGDFEDIDSVKQLYLDEFNKKLSIKDFKE